MSRMALTFPVLPGKDARDIANELKSRPREYEESRRRAGITMERAYLQHTPMGDYVTAYLEGEGDVLEAFGKLGSPDLAIDRYMAKAAKEIHGADFTQPMPGPAPETVAAWIDPALAGRVDPCGDRLGRWAGHRLREVGAVDLLGGLRHVAIDGKIRRPQLAERLQYITLALEVGGDVVPHGRVLQVRPLHSDPGAPARLLVLARTGLQLVCDVSRVLARQDREGQCHA